MMIGPDFPQHTRKNWAAYVLSFALLLPFVPVAPPEVVPVLVVISLVGSHFVVWLWRRR